MPLSVSSGISQTNVTSTPDSRGVAIGLRVNGVPCRLKLPLDRDHISPPNPEFSTIGKYTRPEVTLASLILISTNGIFAVTFPTKSSEPHLNVKPASCEGFEKSRLLTKRDTSTLSPSFKEPEETSTVISRLPSALRNGSTPLSPEFPE